MAIPLTYLLIFSIIDYNKCAVRNSEVTKQIRLSKVGLWNVVW
jgi:hypothetical protein